MNFPAQKPVQKYNGPHGFRARSQQNPPPRRTTGAQTAKAAIAMVLGWAAPPQSPHNRLKYNDMELVQSHETSCPVCGESITLTLDLSVPEQSYIEDCPVCCNPMVVSYSADDGELAGFNVDAA